MFRKITLASVIAVGLLFGAAKPADASIWISIGGGPVYAPYPTFPTYPTYPYPAPYPTPYPIPAPVLHHYHVEYRLPGWHERTFLAHWQAHQFADLKRAEGFDVSVVPHLGSQVQVRYRMIDWRTFTIVGSHSYAHELVHLLRARGYQARVIHH